jgi:hypothetical protein
LADTKYASNISRPFSIFLALFLSLSLSKVIFSIFNHHVRQAANPPFGGYHREVRQGSRRKDKYKNPSPLNEHTCLTEDNPLLVLITGISSDSIAGELAVQLAAANPKLLILSARAESKVTEVAEKIKALSPTVSTRFLSMDLGSFAAIRNAVDDLADVTTIDHLVCVAGVMSPPYGKTVDGIEQQLAINYVANFLLVKLLLPKIQAAGPSSSVVVVASSMVRIGKMDFDDWNFSVSITFFLPFPSFVCFIFFYSLTFWFVSIGWQDL